MRLPFTSGTGPQLVVLRAAASAGPSGVCAPSYRVVAVRRAARARAGATAHHKFTGTRRQNVKERFRKLYLTNAYRVLLTRARQGIVVYVPNGDPNDATRLPEFYDGTAEFLLRCGIEPIECK
jgi:hypothetical protein